MIDTVIIDNIIHGRVDPYIYAFETNTVPNFLKVGDTYRPVEVRLEEWRKLYSNLKKKYEHIAKVDEKTYFRDYAVHDFLMRNGFRRIEKSDIPKAVYFSNEFFLGAKKQNVEKAIADIQQSFDKNENKYIFYDADEHLPLGDFDFKRDADWKPRENQKVVIKNFDKAVKQGRTNLLMFAVMRFGKSFTSLCCAKAMNAKLIIVVCGKTAVRSEWKENVQRPKIFDGFFFVDADTMLKDPTIVSKNLTEGKTVVVFLTMQDLLGENIKNKHKDLFNLNKRGKIDLLIIDETHFGARANEFGKVLGSSVSLSVYNKISKQERVKGYDESFDELENEIKVFSPRVKLHLSGTPYRILLDNEFESDDIVGTVQYSDIIDEKEKWDRVNIEKDEWENPYYGFPQMIRFAFNLNESAKAKLAELKNNGCAHDLSELFAPESTSKKSESYKKFKHEKEVLDLLKAIDGSKNDSNIFPFLNYEKIEKGKMCRHIVMVLPNCASCDAMANLIQNNKFNKLNEYEIINIAGFDCDKVFTKPNYALQVKQRIESFEAQDKKTISLTVGKMLTGSTVKEWDTMIFLRNTASPQDYDQAIFRLQNPYIKTIASKDSNKIIKYDMKPQTLLVDFDPVRMFTLQHKKSLIANINNYERGNENLMDKIARELEIAPIIYMNHSKLQKVEAKDIVDSIRNYNAQKSVMDETFDIEIDERIFDDDLIRAIIEKQPELTSKGVKFEVAPHTSNGESTNIDIPDNVDDTEDSSDEVCNDSAADAAGDAKKEISEIDTLKTKLQGYYFKLLLFAFVSEQEENSISDIIHHIKNDADGKRIGKNLQIDVAELKLIHSKINPMILSYLENKIQNINQLGKEITPANIGVALRKMSRLSVSEIITPEKLADEMVNSFPEELSAKSKFLDIASKTGEFATALLKKYGKKVKNNIYSIPTSPVTYECTRKIYRCLGLPVEHIYTTFTSYDLIDNTKNETILKEIKDMKFDVTISNPPYQTSTNVDGRGAGSIYYMFIDAATKLSRISTLIHPARFLFNAGNTPRNWNVKMLNDEHYKIIHYWANSSDVFPVVDIEGGVAVTCYDHTRMFKRIGTFVAHKELQSILSKIKLNEFKSFAEYVYPRTLYRFTDRLYEENSWAKDRPSKGHLYDMSSNAFDLFDELFFDEQPKDENEYVRIYGRKKTDRVYKWIKKTYIKTPDNFDFYKVFVPTANGSGAIGEVLSTLVIGLPVIGLPLVGHTETFLSIGKFKTKKEADACLKYVKTRFARAMIGTLKTTQNGTKEVWTNVPLQDFTPNSDIDWSKSVVEIDKQLYKKYGLSAEEIAFIESKVKEM